MLHSAGRLFLFFSFKELSAVVFNMHLNADQINALLQALGLTQSIFKPIPDLLGGLLAPLDPVISALPVDGVVSAVDGITSGLGLPRLEDLPLIGNLLTAKDTSSVQSPFQALSVGNRQQIMAMDGSCIVQPYDPPPILSQTFPPFDQAKATIYRYRQQQSVNLGSWYASCFLFVARTLLESSIFLGLFTSSG